MLDVWDGHNIRTDSAFNEIVLHHQSRFAILYSQLKVGAGGIRLDSGSSTVEGAGSVIYSDTGNVDFRLGAGANMISYGLEIGSLNHKSGLRIMGNGNDKYDKSAFSTQGIRIHGDLTALNIRLFYSNPVPGFCSGNIYIDNSEFKVSGGTHFSRNHSITLKNSAFHIGDYYSSHDYSAGALLVEGVSHFILGMGEGDVERDSRFFLDDLWIKEDSSLTVSSLSAFSYLLVRKDSAHLYESLEKLRYLGSKTGKAELRDYSRDYWRLVPNLPEPTTYGAIFGVLGLGLVAFRKRRNGGR